MGIQDFILEGKINNIIGRVTALESAGSGVSVMNDLTDVNIASPSAGGMLVYDGPTNKYVEVASGSLGGSVDLSGSGTDSIQVGDTATASGNYSVAVGETALADFQYGVAVGYESDAGNSYAVSIGYQSQAVQSSAVAVGYQSQANGGVSVAVGRDAVVSSSYGVRVGYDGTLTAGWGIGIGYNVYVVQNYSIGIGSAARAERPGAIAIGGAADVGDDYGIAIGYNSLCDGEYSTAIGNTAEITTGHNYSFLFGRNADSDSANQSKWGSSSYPVTYWNLEDGRSKMINFATRTVKITVGHPGEGTTDVAFTSQADQASQDLHLVSADFFPSSSELCRITDVLITCTEAIAGGPSLSLGLGTISGFDNILTAQACNTPGTHLSSTSSSTVTTGGSGVSLFLRGNISSANWDTMSAGQWEVYVTYIDYSKCY